MDTHGARRVQRVPPQAGVEFGQEYPADIENQIGLLHGVANRGWLGVLRRVQAQELRQGLVDDTLVVGGGRCRKVGLGNQFGGFVADAVSTCQRGCQDQRLLSRRQLRQDCRHRRLELLRIASLTLDSGQCFAAHRCADDRHQPVDFRDDDVGRHALAQRLADDPFEFFDAVVRGEDS